MTSNARVAELSANLAGVRRRIAAAAQSAGRDPADITLVAVSKTWPAADVLGLHSLGVVDFGESYDQEAKAKADALQTMGLDVRWHFVGRLQRNKCASIARYADLVHAVDRAEVVAALAAAAARAGREIGVLVQVSLDGDSARGGTPPGQVLELAATVAAAEGVTLRGVMAVAPLGGDPDDAFAVLSHAAEVVRAEHPGARIISAGMTSDLEAAISNGSTCVRVGTALFGRRDHVLD
ncbi:MAG: YggS family pyridoxal phosphate-dependent enzyme [Actinomycetota bacterium]